MEDTNNSSSNSNSKSVSNSVLNPRERTQTDVAQTLRIPYDSLTLQAVIAELRPLLIGGQIQEIRQPTPSDVTLTVRNHNRNHTLLLSLDARYARAHLTTRRRTNPPSPPNFCMVLRKYLENSWIRNIQQVGFDRILTIEAGQRPAKENQENQQNQENLDARSEPNTDSTPPPIFTLVAELMGKHSNLILVNEEATVLDSAKRISHRINRVREILPGLTYQPPPTQTDRVDPLVPDAVPFLIKESGSSPEFDQTGATDLLLQLYVGISPFLAREMATRLFAILTHENATDRLPPLPPGTLRLALEQVWDTTVRAANLTASGVYPTATRIRNNQGEPIGAYPIPILQATDSRTNFNTNLNTDIKTNLNTDFNTDFNQKSLADANILLNTALDEAFEHQIAQAGFQAITGELRGQLQQESKRLERQRQSVLRTLAEVERSEQYKQTGELILANLWRIESGSREVVVQDYYDPAYGDRTVELDPKLTGQENADLYFRRYRKARDAEDRALQEDARLDERTTDLRVALAALNHAKTEEELRALRADLLARQVLRPVSASAERERSGAEPEFAGHKIRRFPTPQGFDILVGENATSNDYLTLRVAASNDWWLHVRAAVSAHVVIRTHGKPYEVPRSVLERAALLCAQHSQQKHSSLVSVDYTLKKYVRKPRSSAAGAADYKNEQTIDVQP